MFASSSRGLLQLVMGKNMAYYTQAASVALFTLMVLAWGRSTARSSLASKVAYGFLTVCAISAALTVGTGHWTAVAPYLVVTAFYVFVIVALGTRRYAEAERIAFGPVIAALSSALMAGALAQSVFGANILPGADTASLNGDVRPSSITGAFLHYPITLALVSFILLGLYVQTKVKAYAALGAASATMVILSFSRSGVLLLVAGVIAAALLSSRKVHALALASTIIAVGCLFGPDLARLPYVQRALSAFDLSEGGNAGRVDVWESTLSLWSNTNLFFGEWTGYLSNVTNNADGVTGGVAESGFLQQLASFGLVGAIAYYALLIIAVRSCVRCPVWYRAGMIAAIAESLVYQSIEVFPFVVMFAVVPFIANSQSMRSSQAMASHGYLSQTKDRRRLVTRTPTQCGLYARVRSRADTVVHVPG